VVVTLFHIFSEMILGPSPIHKGKKTMLKLRILLHPHPYLGPSGRGRDIRRPGDACQSICGTRAGDVLPERPVCVWNMPGAHESWMQAEGSHQQRRVEGSATSVMVTMPTTVTKILGYQVTASSSFMSVEACLVWGTTPVPVRGD
jgi:hypothetical protein